MPSSDFRSTRSALIESPLAAIGAEAFYLRVERRCGLRAERLRAGWQRERGWNRVLELVEAGNVTRLVAQVAQHLPNRNMCAVHQDGANRRAQRADGFQEGHTRRRRRSPALIITRSRYSRRHCRIAPVASTAVRMSMPSSSAMSDTG